MGLQKTLSGRNVAEAFLNSIHRQKKIMPHLPDNIQELICDIQELLGKRENGLHRFLPGDVVDLICKYEGSMEKVSDQYVQIKVVMACDGKTGNVWEGGSSMSVDPEFEK